MPIKFTDKDDTKLVQDVTDLATALDATIGAGEGSWEAEVVDDRGGDGLGKIHITLRSKKHGRLLIRRIISVKPGGRAEIYHDYFTLPKELQGKGLADPVMDFTRKQMSRFKIEVVHLHANIDVGGYAWLRKGFMPNAAVEWLEELVDLEISVQGGALKYRDQLTADQLTSMTARLQLAQKLKALTAKKTKAQLAELFLAPEFSEFKTLFLGKDWFGTADLTNEAVRAALFKTATTPTKPNLVDNAIRHTVQIERLKAAEVRDFNRLIPLLEKQATDVLVALKVKSLNELDRATMNATLRLLRQAQQAAAKDATDKLLARLSRISEYETKFEASSLQALAAQAGTTAAISAATPAAAWALANAVPLSATGDLLGAWVKEMTDAEVAQINKVILRGFSEGWTNDDLFEILRGTRAMAYSDGLLSRMGKHNATIVRTAIQHVAATAREATWQANSDLIDKYRWLSTLDSRTSPQCRSLDGQEFELGKGPRPPIHPNCRSTTIPVLRGKLRVLQQDKTRASMDGPVDADLSYYEWLSQQSASFQEDVLGPSRYKMFKAPNMSADKFARLQLNSAFEPLTLEELERLGR